MTFEPQFHLEIVSVGQIRAFAIEILRAKQHGCCMCVLWY